MPIPVACSGCGKRFQAPDHGAGKKVPCPVCKTTIAIPAPILPEEEEDYRLAEEEPRAPAPAIMWNAMPPPSPAARPPAPPAAPFAPATQAVPRVAHPPAPAPNPPHGFTPPPAAAAPAEASLASGPSSWVPAT